MRAALLHGYGSADLFRMATVPEPVPGPGQIRVRVAGAGVNPVDIKARREELPWLPLTFPARLGGDVAGIVDAIGEGVTDFKIGDRVMGMLNPTIDGAYAEKTVFHAERFAHVPADLDLIDAAALPIGVLTGVQLIEHCLGNIAGKKILVTG